MTTLCAKCGKDPGACTCAKNVVPIRKGIVPSLRAAVPTPEEIAQLPQSGLRQGTACHHERSRVDKQARRVFCRDCGVDLDPIDVLAKCARLTDQWTWLHANKRELVRDIEDLKRQRDNLRASVRRAAKGQG